MPLNNPQKVLFYRMFPALLKADEAYMGLDALGSGILFGILNHQCINGSVPADPVALAGLVRAKPEEVREFLATFTKLKTLEALEGGPADRLANPYLHKELKAIHALIEARRQAGAKGGQKTQAKARPVHHHPHQVVLRDQFVQRRRKQHRLPTVSHSGTRTHAALDGAMASWVQC